MSKPFDPFYYQNQIISEALNLLGRPYHGSLEELVKYSQGSHVLELLNHEANSFAHLGVPAWTLDSAIVEPEIISLQKQVLEDTDHITNAINDSIPDTDSLLNVIGNQNFSEYDCFSHALEKQKSDNIKLIENFLNPTLNNIEQLSNEYVNLIDRLLNPLNLDFLEKLQDSKKTDFRMIIEWLLTHGWILDWSKSFFKIFKTNSDDGQKLTDIFNFFKNKAKNIAKKAVKLSPHRKKIIKAAYKAHKRGEYELSVPVFLSQSEGVAIDHLGIDGLFYKNKENKQKIEKLFIDCDKTSYSVRLISKFKSPIFKDSNLRTNNFKGLNRHLVLHGESTNYATEENSLKCLALMGYICQMIQKIKPN